MNIHVDNPCGIPEEEVAAYVQRAENMVENGELPADLCRIELNLTEDDEVEIRYYKSSDVPIDRIRRITGYLVGTLDRWCDSKRAEERDRVKHL